MLPDEVWDDRAAEEYDTPGEGMFEPAVVLPAVDFLAGLADAGAALEFAIGTGRIAVPLAARGVAVSGIDSSRAMIARLRSKAPIPVVVGDMATASVPGPFALVYVVYNAISTLLTQEAQVTCFRNAARHLAPGGRFVVEVEVPDLRALPPGKGGVVFESSSGYLGVDTVDVLHRGLVSHHLRFDRGREATLFRSAHRYVWPSELDLMGRLAGFPDAGVPAAGRRTRPGDRPARLAWSPVTPAGRVRPSPPNRPATSGVFRLG
ncbi:class I SAM-dependent methyltransferase [Actinoplanes sp. NPDC051411]|jgi:SAM-dependent methyltransferase|uniref:class I SAM-dependent methyltransferase n=1 Tax=Actinoplanes sp. NPDC051411 TaxID=3155522 RepID=UPI003423F751